MMPGISPGRIAPSMPRRLPQPRKNPAPRENAIRKMYRKKSIFYSSSRCLRIAPDGGVERIQCAETGEDGQEANPSGMLHALVGEPDEAGGSGDDRTGDGGERAVADGVEQIQRADEGDEK